MRNEKGVACSMSGIQYTSQEMHVVRSFVNISQRHHIGIKNNNKIMDLELSIQLIAHLHSDTDCLQYSSKCAET